MKFITFEGPEGSGKSTQIALLARLLRQQGVKVMQTREPGGTPIGDQIRQIIVGMENEALVPSAEFLLFSASRAQLIQERIRPALDKGQIVLCDRFFDSSLAYQGYGHGLPLEHLRMITAFATNRLVPDITILLDLDVEVGLRRRFMAAKSEAGEWNRLDAQTVAFHQRVRAGYHALAAAEPSRWRIVDASQEPQVVHEAILGHLGVNSNT
jgi:dTMP kinase